MVATAGTRLSTHTWRSAAAGNLGGWQVPRTLFLLNALLGAVATEGGTYPNAWNKFVPRPMYVPPHPRTWNDLTWPIEYPLAINELSFLLPHLLRDSGKRLAVYFTRVYNPVWTNPDGFSWIEMLLDPDRIGCYVALTPTWNETAFFADYILPMGHASERHDLHSYEQYDGQWIGFRQPVLRAARERLGERLADTRAANPGEVWEENEFWIELSWRIDPDGVARHPQVLRVAARPPARSSASTSTTGTSSSTPCRGCRSGRRPRGSRRSRSCAGTGRSRSRARSARATRSGSRWPSSRTSASAGSGARTRGRLSPRTPNIVPVGSPEPDAEGRRPVGVQVDGEIVRGFPTPSGRLEFYSRTLVEWGWPECALPTYLRSHVHREALGPDQMVLISTFRLPVQIHTRSANAKWLDEIAHTNPLWMHPRDAAPMRLRTGDLVRVETEIGYFVVKAWVTEGIRPGVVACSHHMGRWKLQDAGQRQAMATVTLDHREDRWAMHRVRGGAPYASADPDTLRIWWTDVGVHQNLTFPVHPDPVSGQHCWHQAVRVRPAEAGDRYGDISVDTARARDVYAKWLGFTRPADRYSPDGSRRPWWLMRPLRPAKEAYRLPDRGTPAPVGD